jgi:hypothetical protein
MEWLSHKEMEQVIVESPNATECQVLSVFSNTAELATDIPVEPRLIEASEGPPSPMWQWNGRIGVRVFTVETEVNVELAHSFMIYTAY